MPRFAALLMLCATLVTLPFKSFAADGTSEWVSTGSVHSQLVASDASVRSGQTFNVAWHVKIDPEWHIYWSNPGDSGLPPTLVPTKGFTAGPLTFPTPKLISIPPIMNYGYGNEVVLTAPVTAPPTLAQGHVDVPVTLTYLYCSNEVCMPGRVSTTLPLTATLGEPVANPEFAALQQQQAPALPQTLPADAQITAHMHGRDFVLRFHPDVFGSFKTVRFLPSEDGVIEDSADQAYSQSGNMSELTLIADPQATMPPKTLRGLLLIDNKGYTFETRLLTAVTSATTQGGRPALGLGGMADGLFFALLSAFIAGLILNLMPCVLPVLALKAFALLKGHQNKQAAYRHALGYTLGVVGSFMALGATTLIVQGAGHTIGWGFQLQQPLFVAALCALMVGLALSFFGVVEVGTSLTRLGQTGKAQHLGNDVLTGLLAVIVATPCTVPFMGGAVAYALTQPAAVTLLVFFALGLGMATPLVAITLVPGLARVLPKPGAWLDAFKQFLGWPLLATALWLLWVYNHQTDALHFFTLLAALLAFAFGLWLYGRKPSALRGLVLAILFSLGAYGVYMPPMPTADWQTWSATEVDSLRPHRPVFVDFTADWCLSCKVNEATVLNTARTQALFQAKNVALFKADWTTQNPDISAALEKHGRRGVPLYLLYLPGQDAIVLPQILTYGKLEEVLR
jgi:thiol:disulfide interchange protein DsbD